MAYTLQALADQFDATLHGDGACTVERAASVVAAGSGDICFAESLKYADQVANSGASAIILTEQLLPYASKNALVVRKPRLIFAQVLQLLYPKKKASPRIHPTAVIGEGCEIDETVEIGAHVVIGDRVTIGAGGIIYPNVTIYDGVRIGKNAIIHAGAVIGADGFGFEMNEKREWIKVPQIGSVIIGDDVEIGACATIDRGALEDTIIGNGVKLDDHVMIAHNAEVGDHTLFAGHAGIAGSGKVGKHCIIGGRSSINGHITVTDGVVLTGCAMVTGSLSKPGIYSSGTGLLPHRDWQKSAVRFRHLDKMYRKLQDD